MKSLFARVKRFVSNHSLRTKLLVSFALPVICMMILAMFIVHGVFWARSETETLERARSNFDQGYGRIVNFIDTMSNVSDTIYYNGDLQRILSDSDYLDERTALERYHEFIQLNEVFATAERATDIFRAGVYLRDSISYTNNVMHFMPMLELIERSDYMRYIYTVRRDKYYFSPPVDIYTPGVTVPTRAVTLLRPIRTTQGSSKQIAIQQICVEVDAIEQVLQNTATSPGAFVYLADEYSQLITATDADRYYSMKSDRTLPLNADDDGEWQQIYIDGEAYYMLRSYLTTARWTLVTLIPENDIAQQSNYITITIVLITFLLLLIIGVVSFLLANSFTRRLENLNTRIQRVRAGEMDAQPPAESSNDEISALFVSFSEMTGELKNLMRAQYRSGKAVKTAELKALQAQINPHFLYNTLDLINWVAFDHDAPEISEIAQSLAKFYRISLNKGRQIVTIGEELDHVRAYVDIENHHFENNIHLSIEVSGEIQALGCINIILQPFAENAIMHGIAKDINRRECNISITAEREENDVVLTVRDDGPGMTPEQIHDVFLENTVSSVHGYGVQNIEARIRLSFGEGYGVAFESSPGHGTTVRIRLPALTPEEAEMRISEE